MSCPFKDKCLVDSKQSCWESRIVYKISCNLCQVGYLGTSGYSSHKRCWEHQKAFRLGNESYGSVKHFKSQHKDLKFGESTPFSFEVVRGPNIQGNLQRYLGEALEIRNAAARG